MRRTFAITLRELMAKIWNEEGTKSLFHSHPCENRRFQCRSFVKEKMISSKWRGKFDCRHNSLTEDIFKCTADGSCQRDTTSRISSLPHLYFVRGTKNERNWENRGSKRREITVTPLLFVIRITRGVNVASFTLKNFLKGINFVKIFYSFGLLICPWPSPLSGGGE